MNRMIELDNSGRVEIGPDDPLYRALMLSRACIAKLEQMERDQAAAWARVRNMPLGSDALRSQSTIGEDK
jgi:hypothetical protein